MLAILARPRQGKDKMRISMRNGTDMRIKRETIVFLRYKVSLKWKSSPFYASFMLITLYARQGVFVYITSFKCMELFISFLLYNCR